VAPVGGRQFVDAASVPGRQWLRYGLVRWYQLRRCLLPGRQRTPSGAGSSQSRRRHRRDITGRETAPGPPRQTRPDQSPRCLRQRRRQTRPDQRRQLNPHRGSPTYRRQRVVRVPELDREASWESCTAWPLQTGRSQPQLLGPRRSQSRWKTSISSSIIWSACSSVSVCITSTRKGSLASR
jgi:hypothetical protein